MKWTLVKLLKRDEKSVFSSNLKEINSMSLNKKSRKRADLSSLTSSPHPPSSAHPPSPTTRRGKKNSSSSSREVESKVVSLRGLPAISSLLKELENTSEKFEVKEEVLDELRDFLEVRSLLPSILNHQKVSNVRKAQRALIEMESRLDRCLKVQDEVRVRLRFFSRLEFEVKQDLFRVGFITHKSSKPSVDQAVSIAVPELVNLKEDWKGVEFLCRDLHKRLTEAKDTIKLVMKLDDNYRWSNVENPS